MYVKEIVQAFDEVWRVLHPTGLAWLNIADTWSGSGGAGGDWNKPGKRGRAQKWKQGDTGIAPMQACLVPYRVALALQHQGWLIRQSIIWDRGRVRPEDVRHTRRPLIAYEQIFMLAKTRGHRFFPDELAELGNVWHFRTTGGNQHLAPFPEELPRRCILISTAPGEVVLDPFAGSGTTVRVADELGRQGLGCDLYRSWEPANALST